MKLEQLRSKRNEAAVKVKAIADLEANGATLTAEQMAEFEENYAAVESLDAQVKRAERSQGVQARLDEPRPSVGAMQFGSTLPGAGPVHPGGPEASREFATLNEWSTALAGHFATKGRVTDQRLEYGEPSQRGEQNMGDGPSGGFMVPKQFRGELLSVDQAAAAVRPRARVIPAGTPPDAEISMPALDQSSAQNMYGGVEVAWIAEGGTKPPTDAKLREVRLAPKEVAATVVLTDKLLRNWQAAGAILSELLRKAMGAAEDAGFINGSGVGRPLGFLGSGALITVNRAGANTIAYEDVVAMEASLLAGAQPVWLTTRRAVGELRMMEDTEGHLIWTSGNAVEGRPPTLLGYPVLVVPRMPALGTLGDLVLVDLSYYLIKDGSGPFIASSEHVHFATNKTVIKAFWNVDGAPWLNTPIVQENGDTQSPFVALDVPSA